MTTLAGCSYLFRKGVRGPLLSMKHEQGLYYKHALLRWGRGVTDSIVRLLICRQSGLYKRKATKTFEISVSVMTLAPGPVQSKILFD